MRILRVRTVAGVEYMKDKILQVNLDIPLDFYVDSLKRMITAGMDNLLILQAWEGDSLEAFVIAFLPEASSHVWLAQAWVSPSLANTKVADRLFMRLLMWGESVGRSEVRMETQRNAQALLRRWNFKEHSIIMNFKIDRDLDEKLISGNRDVLISQGEDDGKKQRNDDADEKQSDEGSTDDIIPDSGETPAGTGNTSGPI